MARLARIGLARRRAAFPRLRRRAQPPAARLSLGRSRGDRRDAGGGARARRSAARRCSRSACRWAAARCSTGSGARARTRAAHVAAAAAVSAPLDLMAAGIAIDQGFNRLSTRRHFLRTLKPKALAMARRFPGLLDARRVARARTLWEFDDAVTAPLHGFAGTDDYWTRASSQAVARATSRCRRWCSTRGTIRSFPARRCPTRSEVSAAVVLRAARRTAATSASRRRRFRATSTGCRSGCRDVLRRRRAERAIATASAPPDVRNYATHRPPSLRSPAMTTLPREIFKAYDIRGIVGRTLTPAIVRADRPGAGHARARARPRHVRHRPRRPAVRARSSLPRWPTASAPPAPTSSTSAWSPRR